MHWNTGMMNTATQWPTVLQWQMLLHTAEIAAHSVLFTMLMCNWTDGTLARSRGAFARTYTSIIYHAAYKPNKPL